MQQTINLLLLIIIYSTNYAFSQMGIMHTQRVKSEHINKGVQNQDYTIRQGFDMNLWISNRGVIGRIAGGQSNPLDGRLGLEYPINSGIEHIYGAGLWIGAIIDTSHGGPPSRVKAVTTSFDGGDPPLFEMYGNPNGRDSFYVDKLDNKNGRNVRCSDDDGDGKVDEDELDGIDNDGDGLIDEDYGVVSENDAYVSYTDTFSTPIVSSHIPLGIRIWQRSYAWANSIQEPIIFLDYLIINSGQKILDSVYIGFFADGNVGSVDKPEYQTRNYSGYLPDVRTAYVHNPVDTPSTPIGVTVVGTPKPLDGLCYTFQWYPKNASPQTDSDRYNLMSLCGIKPDEYPNLSDTRFLLAFGPFESLQPLDTLKVVMALVSGDGVQLGWNNLQDNAARALEFYARGYHAHLVPPSPPLHLIKENGRVTLDWIWRPGDPRFDPLETWDDSNMMVGALPDTHWRKRNPPQGQTKGGRIFEGFNVWRSDTADFHPRSFQHIAQFDIDDDLGFNQQTGLQFTMIDSNVIPGHRYWYSVTSFSIPDRTIIIIPLPGGGLQYDTIWSAAYESWIGVNANAIDLTTDVVVDRGVLPVSFELCQAYPNPFNPSTTISYQLPSQIHVTLKVYDVLGQKVATLVNQVEQPGYKSVNFNATTLASGIYFYRLQAGNYIETKKLLLLR